MLHIISNESNKISDVDLANSDVTGPHISDIRKFNLMKGAHIIIFSIGHHSDRNITKKINDRTVPFIVISVQVVCGENHIYV